MTRGPKKLLPWFLLQAAAAALTITAWPAGLSAVPAPASANSVLGTLHVRIVGLRSDRGLVKVGMYASGEAYAKRQGSFRKAKLPIVDGVCEWDVAGVPDGEYAVMFYHDRNANNRLDRNVFGLPAEPYGFSNNARPRLGPPSFDAVKFPVQGRRTTIEIAAQAR